jgi:hypothetical protein
MSGMSNMWPAGRKSCVALLTTQMWPIRPSGDPRFDMPAVNTFPADFGTQVTAPRVKCSLFLHTHTHICMHARTRQVMLVLISYLHSSRGSEMNTKSQLLRNRNGYTFANSKELRQNNNYFSYILGAFLKLRKATISFIMSVCPFAWNNSAAYGRIFITLHIWLFFKNTIEKFLYTLHFSSIYTIIQQLHCSDSLLISNSPYMFRRMYVIIMEPSVVCPIELH